MSAIAVYDNDCLREYRYPWYMPSPMRRLPLPLLEFWSFGIKEALSCAFAVSFFITLALSKALPMGDLPRYDFILIVALAVQFALVYYGLETKRELAAVSLFHLLGLALEIFKTSPTIGSWAYPEFAYSKLAGVPLYSGFMYAAVASYMLQSWRYLSLRLAGYPPHWLAVTLAFAIYLNFFTHHFIGDYRWPLTLALVAAFWRTRVYFRPMVREFWMPMPLAFLLIGFFIWIAENVTTLFGGWQYPNQTGGWELVHLGKISSWGLLVVITFTIIAELKFFSQRKESENKLTN
ncbi:membrane protein [Leminorella grimontii]|uniref:Membrane protein n=1 Tax=Leminorella grimontii TaxID=82981 RepID=A0AAV5N3D0_9GAMM|nr:DUF817 domain-containing protein [Leminorella grimontii]KFC94742.1 putative membrane protein [Leminorella grimontii ATCC 33999 = DSM 5078]GKX56485.1 membrane protein [Leminorella grimontii]VFS61417.1 Uncharacterized integral membrane protein [Leminorella grimontii]